MVAVPFGKGPVGKDLGQVVRGQVALGERLLADDFVQEGQVRLDAVDAELFQGQAHLGDALSAALAAGDEFGEHGVVVDRDLVALGHAAVDPHAQASRLAVAEDAAGLGEEAVGGIFGIDASLQCVTALGDLFLAQRQAFAAGDEDLPAHQVDAGRQFGDRMLDLEAGVHFQEVEAAVLVEHELDRAGADVVDRAGRGQGRLRHATAQVLVQGWGGRLLEDLLVAALDRAFALEQVHDLAVAVAEDLELDMARAHQVFLQKHRVVAEGGTRLAFGGFQLFGEGGTGVDDPHALAAAAGGGLDQQRIADAVGLGAQAIGALVIAVVARHDRHAALDHAALGDLFGAHHGHDLGAGADERQARGGDPSRELGVLGEEAETGVDGIGAGGLGGLEDGVDIEVGGGHGGRSDRVDLVGDTGVKCVQVGLRGHGHACDTQFATGLDDADGDFAAVGDEDFFHGCAAYIRKTPYLTSSIGAL